MKTIFFTIGIILCGYFISGCSKDSSITTAPQSGVDNAGSINNSMPDSGIYTLRIFASQMVQNTNVYTYTEIIAAPVGQPAPVFKIFLLHNNNEIPIDRPVSFMHGTIWANIDGLSVKLFYRNESGATGLPFYFLDIRMYVVK